MPAHSVLFWAIYLTWTLGFAATAAGIAYALGEAWTDRAQVLKRGINGILKIEANRAIRLEVVRLAQALIFTALGLWAIISPEPQAPSPRGIVTLVVFLVVGALICSQTWFDRIDRRAEMALHQ